MVSAGVKREFPMDRDMRVYDRHDDLGGYYDRPMLPHNDRPMLPHNDRPMLPGHWLRACQLDVGVGSPVGIGFHGNSGMAYNANGNKVAGMTGQCYLTTIDPCCQVIGYELVSALY